MAAYQDLRQLYTNSELRNRTEVALAVTAHDLSIQTTPLPSADDLAWVGKALGDTGGEALKALKFVLAENKDATTAQILGATDVQLQTNVDQVRSSLVSAYAAERTAGGGP